MTQSPTSSAGPRHAPLIVRDASGAIDWERVRARLEEISQATEQAGDMSAEAEANLLAERARLLASPLVTEAVNDHIFLHVRLGSEAYAVPADDVGAVATEVELAALPGATGALVAVAAWRSRLLRVIDIRTSLGLAATPSRSLLVIGDHERDLALIVDSVEDSVLVNESTMQPVPSEASTRGLLRGILEDGTPVLNLHAAVRLAGFAVREA